MKLSLPLMLRKSVLSAILAVAGIPLCSTSLSFGATFTVDEMQTSNPGNNIYSTLEELL